MSVVHDVFMEYGMHSNMKPGKTALLLGLNGAGAIGVQRTVGNLHGKCLSCVVRGGGVG